jgi:hypothetical protein
MLGKIENKYDCKWVSVGWSDSNKLTLYIFCHTLFVQVYVDFSGDVCVYMGLIKERCVHPEKRESSRLYNKPGVAKCL